jgi:hypothetical protein
MCAGGAPRAFLWAQLLPCHSRHFLVHLCHGRQLRGNLLVVLDQHVTVRDHHVHIRLRGIRVLQLAVLLGLLLRGLGLFLEDRGDGLLIRGCLRVANLLRNVVPLSG